MVCLVIVEEFSYKVGRAELRPCASVSDPEP